MGVKVNVVVALLAVAIGASGCGSKGDQTATTTATGEADADSPGDETTAAMVDACSYLTAVEVTAITTDAVQEATREDNSCVYRSKPGNDGLRLTIDLTDGERQMRGVRGAAQVLGGMSGDVAKMGGAGADAAAAMRPDGSDVPKLGDEAAWGMANILSVRKGKAFVQVIPPLIHDPANHSGYPLISDADKRKIAVTVAEKVLAKI